MSLFAKSPKERLNDTLAYMKDHLTGGQMLEVSTVLGRKTTQQQEAISGAMSFRDSADDGKAQRRAMRANILLSQLFIESDFFRPISVSEFALPYLKSASEMQLRSRLRSWWPDPATTEADVCRAALEAYDVMPHWGNNPCDPARIQGRIGPYKDYMNCFSAVMYWAYRSGAVSLRWLWNTWAELEGSDANGVKRNYVMGFNSARVWTERDMVNNNYQIPAGHTVQFVNKDRTGRGTAFGHVVLSLGDGRCMSHNHCAGFREQDVQGGVPGADREAVVRMKAGRTHNISIRALRQGFYSEAEGYHTMHSASPFWLHGLN